MKKTLVVYYSKTGTTAAVAQTIADVCDGDLFELKSVTPFPSDMYETSDMAEEQYRKQQLPELIAVPDVDGYDQILIGTPTWSSKVATPVASFMQQTDFGDREVRFFATSVGRTQGLSMDFSARLTTGHEESPLILKGTQLDSAEIRKWLSSSESE